MSAKTLSSLTEENRELRKQIGCMNGLFQLFDRHHFLTGRRISSHNGKKLLLGPQNQKDSQCTTKALTEKELEGQKEKPRISMESSRASYSSSSCSSTFSSFDSNRTTTQPETRALRQINIPENSFQTPKKEQKDPSLTNETQSHDLRDVVKDSMYREARGLSIKSRGSEEKRNHPMKHVDSPRPLLQKPKAEKPKVITDHDRLALPRFSYDGRESRETFKSAMKLKELPRLSLDSKTSSMKSSSLDSRLNFRENEIPIHDIQTSHNRSSSLVAKLMGLEDFPETPSTNKSRISSQEDFLSTMGEKVKRSEVAHSPRVSENNAASSPSPRLNKSGTRSSIIQMEPAPWRGSSKLVPQDRKAPTNIPNLSSSVYGEIEKRITHLEFKKSGKDLRALKQILEAMQKMRERLENQRGESPEFVSERRPCLEDERSGQSPNFSMGNNRKNYHQIPNMKGPRQLESSIVVMRPAKVIDRVTISNPSQATTTEISHLRRLQTRNPKNPKENSPQRTKANDLTPKNSNLRDSSWHPEKKAARRSSEMDPQRMKVENCNISVRNLGTVSPRSQQSLRTRELQSHPIVPSSESGRVRKHSSKKPKEKGSQNQKQIKSKDLHLSDDQLSEISSDMRYSSYQGDTASVKSESNASLASQIETEFLSLATNVSRKENYVPALKEEMPTGELAVTVLEQPSPVSVLDAAFYSEDLPSPVKKISTVFREDENPGPEEAEWHFENLNHFRDCSTSNKGSYNPKLENARQLVHELRLLNAEPHEKTANQKASERGSLNPDHRYINKILLTSGLLKDTSFISTGDQLLSSCPVINPEMFHVLEQTESIIEGVNGEHGGKTNRTQKIQRNMVFDLVNELLVRKITSGGLFAVRKKRISPEGLLKEVYSEIDRLQRMPNCNLDDEDDGFIRLLNADMMYQSEDWAAYSGEVPELVLDIERLIFKDLINEVVTGEAMGVHDWPKRHCRQLFTK